jgi:hypothetical protein
MADDFHLARVSLLIAEFPHWLEYFTQHAPFSKPDQLAFHRQTINARRACQTACDAVDDLVFAQALHNTLKAWGIGSRGSRLCGLTAFQAALVAAKPSLQALDRLRIDDPMLDAEHVSNALWSIIENLRIVENAPLVAGTKTLHHVLPELIPPMDRAYTQQFFGWHNPQFQYGQEKCFKKAFLALAPVSRLVNARQYVGGHQWNTSVTKVLDNAVVGLVRAAQDDAVAP